MQKKHTLKSMIFNQQRVWKITANIPMSFHVYLALEFQHAKTMEKQNIEESTSTEITGSRLSTNDNELARKHCGVFVEDPDFLVANRLSNPLLGPI